MHRFLVGLFDGLDRTLDGIGRAIASTWRAAWDGALQSIVYGLILTITALRVILGGLWCRLDKLLELGEKGLITVAMMAMVFLSFNDYLTRELGSLAMDVPGGPNMALVLMVWVGFVGASLATRQRLHLAVDASDRILSPQSARWIQGFVNLVACGLSWQLAKGSWSLVKESLEYEDGVEGLYVWEWLAPWFNRLVGLLPGEPVEGMAWPEVTAGHDFPLWAAQAVLPMAFTLMALRFAIIGLFNPAKPVDPGAADELPGITQPRPPGSRSPKDVIFAGIFPGILLGLGAVLWLGKGALLLVAAVLLVLCGAPLFVAIGTGALGCAILIGGYDAHSVVTDMFEATKKHELLAIPYFVLAGQLMTQGSIARRLIDVARALMGRTPGGLGLATVAACVIFAAISGSSPVTVIAIGTIMFPMLVKQGYSERYSMGVLTTAGSLGIIIPPSVPMIVYAIVVSTPQRPISPSDLFLAGVLPGLFMAAMLAVYTLYITRHVPLHVLEAGASSEDSTINPADGYWTNLGRATRRGALSLVLPVLILGGIYGFLTLEPIGIPFTLKFTVTEAAAVAVVYALLVELVIHREMKLSKLPKVVSESGVMMGSLFLILVLAIAFNKFLTLQQIPQQATDWVVAHIDSKVTFIILVNLFLLVLGCVMDILSAILIVAPLIAPIAVAFGLHPIHFAIMFIVNLEIGYLTPPMGINLFVASAVFKRSIIDVIRGVLPFLLLMLFSLAVISWVPALSLLLL